MARRRWKWLLGIIALVSLLACGYDRAMLIYWVGNADLEVEFAVVEASSRRPISGALIDVVSDGGFYIENYKQTFQLVADADGLARKTCQYSMCSGSRSGLGFTDTWGIHLPFWRFRVSAPGYAPSEWTELDVGENWRKVQHVGPRKAKLVVSAVLYKSGA